VEDESVIFPISSRTNEKDQKMQGSNKFPTFNGDTGGIQHF